MDKHQHVAQPPSGRRKFLRQLGMTAVGTAALSGLADVAGLKPAAAATRGMKVRGARNRASVVPDATVTSVTLTCTLCEGCCSPACSPSGIWCHNCEAVTWIGGGIGQIAWAGIICIGGGTSFTLTGD